MIMKRLFSVVILLAASAAWSAEPADCTTSKWGADDRAGSANHTTNPEHVKRALATVKQFKVLTIGKYYHKEAPAFGPRGSQRIPGCGAGV